MLIIFFLGEEGSVLEATQEESRLERFENSKEEQKSQLPLYRRDGNYYSGIEDGTIRTYAGLSATTQERIRRCVYVVLS